MLMSNFTSLTTQTGRKMHSMKRRKLAHPPPPTLTVAKPDSPFTSAPNHQKSPPICASCHRAFFGAKQSQLLECARCHAATCVICSRTCNGCLSATSSAFTQTPYAVERWSMSMTVPSQIPMTSSSRRPALALHTNTALGSVPPPVAGKRRKVRDRDGADDERGEERERDSDKEQEKGQEDGVLPGCGRTVCRSCAFETPERELTTCYDCAARLLGQDVPPA